MHALSRWGGTVGGTQDGTFKSAFLMAITELVHGPILRHYPLCEQSLRLRPGPKKPNNGGLFAPDLLTGFAVSVAIWLSLRPRVSKAVDCRIQYAGPQIPEMIEESGS
jgi:hypothetical protein